ncbi:flagellar hook-basal body protein [Lentibacillus cibarius]|uniref:Flagellar hook-basal body protein n=1 Tax=Lentibacillus cibarius TaxID=2583219 RepID=A0A549YFW6_9BACI|nr:flagellar hook-basal body protein [Lentibacillus cibarius]TRM10737.1 flagellar hook-basal body protein [Lentibacillus cibarius]
MSRTMIQAAVTMNQLQNKLDITGNNLANSQTTGYKNRQAEFSSLLFQEIDNMTAPANAQGRLTPDGIRVGSGAKLGSIDMDFTQGAIQETGRALDTALLGKNHLYQMQVTENGGTETRYTRDGSFYLSPVNNNEEVMLTTKDGHPVLGENGRIVFRDDFDSITIQSDGGVTVKRGNTSEHAGTLAITEAIRPQLLEAAGDNQFRLPDLDELGFTADEVMQAAGTGEPMLKNNALEKSNVDVAKQMTDMISTQRSYQFNARTITMTDQMQGLINQLR